MQYFSEKKSVFLCLIENAVLCKEKFIDILLYFSFKYVKLNSNTQRGSEVMPNKKSKNIQSADANEQFILPDKADFAIDDTYTEEPDALETENANPKENTDGKNSTEETAEAMQEIETTDELTEAIAPDTQENTAEATEEKAAEELTEPTEATDASEEDTAESAPFPTETKNRLLNVEHFSDYKSRAKKVEDEIIEEAEEVTEDAPAEVLPSDEEIAENTDTEDSDEAFSSPAYESITLLDEEAATEANSEEEQELSTAKYDDPDREKYDPEKPRRVDARFDFLELFIFTLVAVMIITTFIFRHSVVEGPSMLNTLEAGDHLIISDTFYTPKRGDIVVCQDHATGHENPIVKRIIAIEGDSIEILANGMVFVNDRLLIEDYVYLDGPDNFQGMAKTVVPEDMVFVMGDHRNLSSDSRTFLSTFVREDAILGKVILRFYPFDKFGTVE